MWEWVCSAHAYTYRSVQLCSLFIGFTHRHRLDMDTNIASYFRAKNANFAFSTCLLSKSNLVCQIIDLIQKSCLKNRLHSHNSKTPFLPQFTNLSHILFLKSEKILEIPEIKCNLIYPDYKYRPSVWSMNGH